MKSLGLSCLVLRVKVYETPAKDFLDSELMLDIYSLPLAIILNLRKDPREN